MKINIDEVVFGEPIEQKEGTYFDGFTQGIYRAKNIIDKKQQEIERLNNIIEEKTYLYNKLSTESEYAINKLNNIINELNKQNIELGEELSLTKDKMNKEIYKREYIINELEKYIGQEWYCFDNESIEYEVVKNILDKLKELKEGK